MVAVCRKHPQVVSLAVTIPVSDIDRLRNAAGPLELSWDSVVKNPERRDVLILYAACGANVHDVTRRLDRGDVLYRVTNPAETERICDCTGEFCQLSGDERTARIAAYA
ncbi:hypothetical protein BH23ACT10_BH23ACT10_39040 [soil metagenome]